MLARFEFDGDNVSSLNVLSIPRDTRVRVPGYGIHKFNAAHAYGGPELACATVRSVFGIDPDYYVDLNFDGFQQVVDSIGGVDVTVHEPLNYDDNWGRLHIHLKPGPQHLNGYAAMGYVRFRHTDNDLMRAQRQHEFIEALRSRITSPQAFLGLPNAVTAITSNIHSNLTMDQMLTLANLARKAPKDAICLETLPVIEGRTFVYIDRHRGPAVVQKMFFKDQRVAVDIKVPEAEAPPPTRRRRHARESAPSASDATHHSPQSDFSPAQGLKLPDEQPSTEPAPKSSGDPVTAPKLDKPDKPAPADPPKTDGGAAPDGDKLQGKPKEGAGTASGSTSTILRA
jgi:LCP family protein required for cell wall assembly